MNKRLLGVAAAAVLAVLGTVAVLAYVRDADDRAQADAELVEVYVYEDRVAAGSDEAALRRAIGTDQVPAGTVVDGVVTDLRQLDGLVAAVDLVPGEQVLRSRLIDAAAYDNGRTRLTSIPKGKSEVTISLDPERVVGGQVVPGDTVGVIATFDPFDVGAVAIDDLNPEEQIEAIRAASQDTAVSAKTANTTHYLLHQVLVTRVQVEELPTEEYDEDGNPIDTGVLAPTGNLLVTLALEAPEIERLVFTAEFGRLWLTQEPLDAEGHDETEVQTRGSVYSHPHEDETELVDSDATTTPASTEADAEAEVSS